MPKIATVYTLEEIAEMLKVTRRTLYTYIKTGALKAIKIGRTWRVTEKQLDEFMNSLNS